MFHTIHRGSIAVIVVFVLLTGFAGQATAEAPADPAFQRIWERTDKPVTDGLANRTWMWGPTGNTTGVEEQYQESTVGMRTVQYFDKSRMEITHPDGDANSIWYVTNGLLVNELVTGRLQLGDNSFEQYAPSQVNVAGDADDPTGPTYATFAGLGSHPALATGASVTQRLSRDGTVAEDGGLASQGVTAAMLAPETGHSVASPFWAFMNSTGLIYEQGQFTTAPLFQNAFYATGFPIAEAYWASVKVGGVYRDVLIQCFERRCLTYTPGNAEGWQVEAGNVGQHYRTWRYEEIASNGPAPCPDSPEGVYIYIADILNDRIQKFDANGNFICQWVGDYTLPDDVARPQTVAVDSQNNVYVLSSGWIQKYDRRGRYIGGWGDYDIAGWDMAIDSQGNLYMTDVSTASVTKYNPTGGIITQWGGQGSAAGQFDSPTGIAVDVQNNIYVADRNNDRVQKFDSNGNFLAAWDAAEDDLWGFPDSLAVDIAGNVYVTSIRVYKFGANGALMDIWGEPGDVTGTGDIAVAADGTIYAIDKINVVIRRFTNSGQLLTSWGSEGAGPGEFNSPVSIAAATR